MSTRQPWKCRRSRFVSSPVNHIFIHICCVYAFSKGAFFWDYSGIGILGIDGICVLLEAIPFSEWTEYHSVHSAPDSTRMNRVEGTRFTRNTQNTCYFGKILAGNPMQPLAPVAAGFISAMGILFPDLGAFFCPRRVSNIWPNSMKLRAFSVRNLSSVPMTL